MGAPRRNKDLPKNLYLNKNSFRYQLPDGKRVSLGTDKEKAIKQAKQLNEKYELHKEKLRIEALSIKLDAERRDNKNEPSFKNVIFRFEGEYLAHKFKDQTLYNKTRVTKRLEDHFRDKALIDIEMKDWSNCFDSLELSHDAFKKHKTVVTQIYEFAKRKGLIPPEKYNLGKLLDYTPPMKSDGVRETNTKKRDKMSSDQFRDVYENAPEWMQDLLKGALLTGLRQGDLLKLRFTAIRDNWICVTPNKTQEDQVPQKIRFEIKGDLKELIDKRRAIAKTQDNCPYVFSCPTKVKSLGKEKTHINQILRSNIVSKFRKLSRPLNTYRTYNESELNPPTFHEIRGLSARLTKKHLTIDGKKFDDRLIGLRLGHRDPTVNVVTSKYSHDHDDIEDYYRVEPLLDWNDLIDGNIS